MITIHDVVRLSRLRYSQARAHVKKMGLGRLVLCPDGRARRVFTNEEIDRLVNRIDGRTLRWQKGGQDGGAQ